MKFITVLISRNKACHVKTLHTVLKLNLLCMQRGHGNEIMFCNDDPYEKSDTIEKLLKRDEVDRIFFVEYGVCVDPGSLEQVVTADYDGMGVLVFPGATEGIDWDAFKKKVLAKSDEPNAQKGLHFDTLIGERKVAEHVYAVKETAARAWVMNTKAVRKKIDKTIAPGPKMFAKLKDQGVKIYAYTEARLTMTYTHEAVSNILGAAGIKVN